MICILFGAGAEQQFGLSGGSEFANKVISIRDSNESKKTSDSLNAAVDDYYGKMEKDSWYPKFKNTKWDKDKLLEAALRKKYAEEEFDRQQDYDQKIKDEIESLENNQDEKEKIIDKYTSYMGILDESFHTLIEPSVFGREKFWRVIVSYARAYAFLIGKMRCNTQEPDKDVYYDILSNWSEAKRIMEEFAVKKEKEKSYYSILKGYCDIRIVTTNYTNLCEKILNLSSDKIAYVHGKFGWFESAKELITYDYYSFNEPLPKDVLFPYITIQSGVKPIVDRRQLEEYSKMLKFIDDAGVIFIVGYRINIDDNHLNSILKEAVVNRGKKLVYFNYKDDLNKEQIFRRLRLIDESNVEIVEIDENNSFSEFEKYLKDYS